MLVRKLKKIAANPLFWSEYAYHLAQKKLAGTPTGTREKTINGIRFEIDFSLAPESEYLRDIYAGLYQMEVTGLLKKHLKAGDTFIDIGANVGYFSCIAAGLVGPEGQVHGFEPVPELFARLERLRALNPGAPFRFNDCGLGAAEEEKPIYRNTANIGNNTFVRGKGDEGLVTDGRSIRIRRFDRYAEEHGLDGIRLIKIDVEGFEYEVLKGMEGIFRRTADAPAIICELTPSAYPALGYTPDDVFAFLDRHGYEAYDIFAPGQEVRAEDITGMRDVFLVPGRT